MTRAAWGLLAGLTAALGVAASDTTEQHWQRVFSGDRKVGFVEHGRRVDGSVFTHETLTLELGGPSRRLTYVSRVDIESAPDGTLRRLVRESKAPEGHTLIDARIDGDTVVVRIGAGAVRHTRTLPTGGVLRSEEFARDWLRAVGAGQAPAPLSYRTFDPAALAIVEVEFAVAASAERPRQIERRTRGAGAPRVALLTLDEQGRIADEGLRLGGITLRLVASTEAEARARGERLDHVAGQVQASPYRIPARDMQAKIRYGFAHRGAPPALPAGAGQRTWSDDQTTWIQVCASCPLEAGTLTDEERARALAPTPWLNFEDGGLAQRARQLTRGQTDAARKMQRLTQYVRGRISATEIDMLGYGSALEAFRERRGDCSEYAVLLAALGRAAGVPTRVVSGMVYARRFEGRRHVFVPHAWVHAWTGTGWQSFDAGIGSFDSTHLAFAVSDDGNPAQMFAGLNLAHQLELRSAARVVPAAGK